jgi:hypothetical protein
MEEASSSQLLKELGEGKLNQQLSSKPNPSCAHLVHIFSNSRIVEAFGFKVALLI